MGLNNNQRYRYTPTPKIYNRHTSQQSERERERGSGRERGESNPHTCTVRKRRRLSITVTVSTISGFMVLCEIAVRTRMFSECSSMRMSTDSQRTGSSVVTLRTPSAVGFMCKNCRNTQPGKENNRQGTHTQHETGGQDDAANGTHNRYKGKKHTDGKGREGIKKHEQTNSRSGWNEDGKKHNAANAPGSSPGQTKM